MDSDFEEEGEIYDDYYTMLNLPKNATSEEIHSAYRNFSKMYHPDKHSNDDSKKKKAETLFNKIKEAYEILSDSRKRAIYDTYGSNSAQADEWQLLPKYPSAAEIRAQYEQFLEEREMRRLQLLTNPESSLVIKIDATDIFNPIEDFEFSQEPFALSSLEITGMSITQSIDIPLTRNDKLILSGQLSTENGKGNGNVALGWRKVNNPSNWIEYGMGIGNGPNVSIKAYKSLPKSVYWNGAMVLNARMARPGHLALQPTLISTFTRQLGTYSFGFCTVRLGMQPNIGFSIIRTTDLNLINCSTYFGLPHSFVSINYTRKMLDYELKLRLNTRIGTFGALVEYGVEKKISKHSNLTVSLYVGVPIGVKLKIRFLRGNQIYSFPIQLCDEIIPPPIIYGTLLPILIYFATKRLIFEPLFDNEFNRRKSKIFEENLEKLKQRKVDAEAAVELMKNTYDRTLSFETSVNGLIILNAIYGKIHPENERICIDVTIPVQCLVKNSELTLQETSKSQLPGFYDPAFGEDKILQINFSYRSKSYEVVIPDLVPLKLPNQIFNNV